MDNYVITIARGLGSGGSHIGRKLASDLGINYYDEEILQMASEKSSINIKYFYDANEKIRKGQSKINSSKGVYSGSIYTVNDKEFLSDENLFNYQAKVMRDLTIYEKQSCVIIGKAANYILGSLHNVLTVNIQAPEDYCIANICKRMIVSPNEAQKLIRQTDKYRKNYYKYYTGRDWISPKEYDLSLNTAVLGENYCVELIKKMLADKVIAR